jgi:hypothetical protein
VINTRVALAIWIRSFVVGVRAGAEAAFKAAEDDGLAPILVGLDQPRTLDDGAAERVLAMVEV